MRLHIESASKKNQRRIKAKSKKELKQNQKIIKSKSKRIKEESKKNQKRIKKDAKWRQKGRQKKKPKVRSKNHASLMWSCIMMILLQWIL
jgi:hypothetical protein